MTLERRTGWAEIHSRLAVVESNLANVLARLEVRERAAEGGFARLGVIEVSYKTSSERLEKEAVILRQELIDFKKEMAQSMKEITEALNQFVGARRVLIAISHILAIGATIAATLWASGRWHN